MRFVPTIAKITPYTPGLPIEHVMRQYGLTEVVKLASNEFPLPPFAEVQQVIREELDDLNRYPDGACVDLRAALAAFYGREPGNLIIGNGSCELIMYMGDALLEPGDEVVYADPSFVVYEDICKLHDARPVAVPSVDYGHDLEAMVAAVTARTKIVIICNPNNPTGTYLPVTEIKRAVEALPNDVLVVIDEAYNECVTSADRDDALRIQAEHENVVVLRTFSKIYGLSGLRVGYGICAPELTAAIDRVRQPFNVNRLAQVAAREALKHQDQVAERRRANAERRDDLAGRLTRRGRPVVPSQANFMLVGTEGLSVPQEQVCGELLKRGVILRDGNALGCPGWARVTIGTPAENEVFLAKLAELEP